MGSHFVVRPDKETQANEVYIKYNCLVISFAEYGVLLTELTLQPDGSPPLRQMAALLLKKYVDTHWSSDSDKFQAPEATPQAKATIRNMLPHGLKESISKVRRFVFETTLSSNAKF